MKGKLIFFFFFFLFFFVFIYLFVFDVLKSDFLKKERSSTLHQKSSSKIRLNDLKSFKPTWLFIYIYYEKNSKVKAEERIKQRNSYDVLVIVYM